MHSGIVALHLSADVQVLGPETKVVEKMLEQVL